jgi:hypothetical protein
MRKATRTRVKLAAIVAGVALAAACQGMKGSPSNPDKSHHKASCVKVTGKAHVEGTNRWYLVLKGHHQSVLVSHKTFKRYDIGECLPTEEI